MGSEHILIVEPTEFATGGDMEGMGMRGSRDN